MPVPYFLWKGKNSLDMGVVLHKYPGPVRPKERTSSITIPGRSGDLTLLEDYDRPVFDPYSITLDCYLREGYDPRPVLEWLRGSGELCFGNTPDLVIDARMSDQFSLSQIEKGRTFYDMDFVVRCQPLKRLRSPSVFVLTEKGGTSAYTITNSGSVCSYPSISIDTGMSYCTLLFGGGSYGMIGFTNIPDDGVYYDVETGLCYNSTRTLLLPNIAKTYSGSQIYGNQPLFPVGTSELRVITGAACTIRIDPNWRYL